MFASAEATQAPLTKYRELEHIIFPQDIAWGNHTTGSQCAPTEYQRI